MSANFNSPPKLLLKPHAIANNNTLLVIAHPIKKRLVARWLVDKNSKLYCQWITEELRQSSK